MIDYFFGNYLMNYHNININYDYNDNNTTALVLIATKPSFWLPFVIKNALHKIKKCNFYFFGSRETIYLLKNTLNININYTEINDCRNITGYSKILLDRSLLFTKIWSFLIRRSTNQ